MNNRIRQLAKEHFCRTEYDNGNIHECYEFSERELKEFAELLVEAVLDQVKERAYYTGDRDWSDEVDRTWIQLEFGYGKLHDAKHGVDK